MCYCVMVSRKTIHPKTVIESLKKDRQKGFSIHELMDKYNLPKTTIWHHVHTVELSTEQKARLLSRQGGSHVRYVARTKKAKQYALKLLCSKNRELVLLVAMLYWAEGHKKAFVFTNTDEKMLLLYLRFLFEIIDVAKEDVLVLVRTSDPIIPIKAQAHWAETLALPQRSIKINHDNKQNRTKTQYGICRITVAKSSFYLKVMTSLVEIAQEEALST
jgi:hypothetical protein